MVCKEDGDWSIDAGDDALLNRERQGGRIATDDHLARESVSAVQCGQVECQFGANRDGAGVGDRNGRVGWDAEVTTLDEATSERKDLGRSEGDVEGLWDGIGSVKDVEE